MTLPLPHLRDGAASRNLMNGAIPRRTTRAIGRNEPFLDQRLSDCPVETASPPGGSMMIAMSRKLRWGVLSTAAIGLKKVIPAMQSGQYTTVTAIASRDLPRAEQAAKALGIEKAYGSYEELLADPDVDAIYNPLPNQMHVPWNIK